jgi:hypothetical protein
MDLALVIAVVGVGIAMVGVVISMMFWMRGEANRLADIQREDRKDILGLIEAIKEDVRAIATEVKDFHTRLYAIEERNKGK